MLSLRTKVSLWSSRVCWPRGGTCFMNPEESRVTAFRGGAGGRELVLEVSRICSWVFPLGNPTSQAMQIIASNQYLLHNHGTATLLHQMKGHWQGCGRRRGVGESWRRAWRAWWCKNSFCVKSGWNEPHRLLPGFREAVRRTLPGG